MRCKYCKNKFKPKWFLQKTCNKEECISKLASQLKKDIEKTKTKKLKKEVEDMKPVSYWIKKLQPIFNEYIRLRDYGLPCITCNSTNMKKINACHYYATSIAPELRFNELNVHAGCEYCNTYLHGNLIEYSKMLPLRIGEDKMKELENLRGNTVKYSRSELKELIEIYKEKVKALKHQNKKTFLK